MPYRLYLGDELIWENPDDLGFFGIKLRKQAFEYRLAKRVDRRLQREKKRKKKEALDES